jgi:hypothetical protein
MPIRIKDADEIRELIKDKIFADCLSSDTMAPSHYLLFIKDTHYLNEPHNNKTLIIIENDTKYVVNNDMRFNKLEITEKDDYDLYEFHYIPNASKSNKSNTIEYLLMK